MTRKIALVTGASSGIGQEIAKQFAKAGIDLVLVARRGQVLETLANELTDHYPVSATVLSCDLSDQSQIDHLIKAVAAIGPLDFVVHAAGLGIFNAIGDFDFDQIQNQFSVNTIAAIYLTNQLIKHDLIQRGGHLLYLASIAGKIVTPSSSVYSATKAALQAFARGIRMELKRRDIKVTLINPGPVDTPFFSHSDLAQNYYENVKQWTQKPEHIGHQVVNLALKQPKRRQLDTPFYLGVLAGLTWLLPRISDWLILNGFNFKEKK